MISDRQRFPQQGLRSAHSGPSQDHARRVLAGRGTRGLGPITMRVGDEVITVLPADPAILDDPVTIVDGPSDDAEVVVEFASPEAFSDFSHEMRTVAGLPTIAYAPRSMSSRVFALLKNCPSAL